MCIDLERISNELQTNPFWYIYVFGIVRDLSKLAKDDPPAYESLKEQLYDLFEGLLRQDKILLGDKVGIWDSERMPIDTVVIHHTSNKPGMTPMRLSAIELMRLYPPPYLSPTQADIPRVLGSPISSGHVRDGKQVFWPYHWFIRAGGTVEHLLEDSEIGWQAGKWAVNIRSVAICFDDDLEDRRPGQVELDAAAKLIRDFYPSVTKKNILGHCEVRETSCPSKLFLTKDGVRGWKEDLLDLVFSSTETGR